MEALTSNGKGLRSDSYGWRWHTHRPKLSVEFVGIIAANNHIHNTHNHGAERIWNLEMGKCCDSASDSLIVNGLEWVFGTNGPNYLSLTIKKRPKHKSPLQKRPKQSIHFISFRVSFIALHPFTLCRYRSPWTKI